MKKNKNKKQKKNYISNPSSMRGNTALELRYATSNQPIIYQSQPKQIDEELPNSNSFTDIEFTYSNDPISDIGYCKGILIRQLPDFLELITGCETCNKYYIFGIYDNCYKFLFKCEENTGCLMKFFFPTLYKKININLLFVSSSESQGTKIANILKPYTCTCCWLCRPELILSLEDSKEIIGKIREACSCFNSVYEIINPQNEIKYLIEANCLQCGLFCSNSICGKNRDANFSILDPKTNEKIGEITKQNNIGKKEEQQYEVKFPSKANAYEKLLLTALGLMIDYQYFEINPLQYKDIIKG